MVPKELLDLTISCAEIVDRNPIKQIVTSVLNIFGRKAQSNY
jgi:hypothetical protein